MQYITKGKHRRQANTAKVESKKSLEDSGSVVVEDPPWRRSKRQGLGKAIAALGEDGLQGLVLQFKQATSQEIGDGTPRAALAVKKSSDYQLRSASSQRLQRVRGGEPNHVGKQFAESERLFWHYQEPQV